MKKVMNAEKQSERSDIMKGAIVGIILMAILTLVLNFLIPIKSANAAEVPAVSVQVVDYIGSCKVESIDTNTQDINDGTVSKTIYLKVCQENDYTRYSQVFKTDGQVKWIGDQVCSVIQNGVWINISASGRPLSSGWL